MNPIRNAVTMVESRKLTVCKRCGTPRLAWVQFNSGKWRLCETSVKRPFYTGENQTPEAAQGYVYANKTCVHHCGEQSLANTRFAVSACLAEALPAACAGITQPEMMVEIIQKNKRIKDAAESAVNFFFSEVLTRKR